MNRGTFFDARGFAAHVEKYRKRFFRRPMNWAMEKSILAARRSPLRNKVRKPAGFPTPFGWAYPVLFCVEVECGHKPSANWGRAAALPLAPYLWGATLQALRASSPQGEPLNLFDSKPEGGGRGGTEIGEGQSPSPCPYPGRGDNPSVSLRADSSPCTGEPKGEADSTSLCAKRQELSLHRGAEG